MKPYYQERARQAELLACAQEWEGTPFLPFGRAKGLGVDCVWLAASLYRETGHLEMFQPGAYTMDGGHHNSLGQVIGWLERNPRFQKVEPPLEVGDLLCFRMGRSVHHVGVVLTERTFLHVCEGYDVREARIDDPTWRKRLACVYRPVEMSRSVAPQPHQLEGAGV